MKHSPKALALFLPAALAFALILVAGCSTKVVRRDASPTLDELLETKVRVMWIAAHPDDEGSVGAVLAKAGRKRKDPLYFLVLTHGDGGACHRPEGCLPDLATVRGEELKQVADYYGATLQHESLYNAALPVKSFPPRHEISKKWAAQSDPTLIIAKAIREFKPDVVLSLTPKHGGSGHPEHQIAARFTDAAVRLAAENTDKLEGEAFRVPHRYYMLNKYPLLGIVMKQDPYEATERFDVKQSCGEKVTCAEMMAEFTRFHRSQNADMRGIRFLARHIDYIYLYKADPFKEVLDPFEPVDHGGMD